jgi:hypothetical protein
MAAPSDFHRGDMEITEQVSTFHGFVGLTKWVSLVGAVWLLVLVLVFCTKAGLFQALLAAVVAAVVGVFLLREKPGSGH